MAQGGLLLGDGKESREAEALNNHPGTSEQSPAPAGLTGAAWRGAGREAGAGPGRGGGAGALKATRSLPRARCPRAAVSE